MNPEFPGVNIYITTCRHGVDLRFTPRCYLCKPWPDDSPVWKVTSPGHVHEGEWCALCVEHGRAPLDVPAWVGVPDANGDIHCSRLAPQRCMWLEGHYGGCATP